MFGGARDPMTGSQRRPRMVTYSPRAARGGSGARSEDLSMAAVGHAHPRIIIRCSSCGARYPVQTNLLHRHVRCTQCGTVFRVEDAGKSPAVPGPASRSRMDPRLGSQLGPFKLIGILGKGGMGTVYEAEDG